MTDRPRAGSAAQAPNLTFRSLVAADWPAVAEIYREGIASGDATFETRIPDWETWDAARSPDCRIIAELDGEIVGFAGLSPVSKRPVYAVVHELMIYIAESARGQGGGRKTAARARGGDRNTREKERERTAGARPSSLEPAASLRPLAAGSGRGSLDVSGHLRLAGPFDGLVVGQGASSKGPAPDRLGRSGPFSGRPGPLLRPQSTLSGPLRASVSADFWPSRDSLSSREPSGRVTTRSDAYPMCIRSPYGAKAL